MTHVVQQTPELGVDWVVLLDGDEVGDPERMLRSLPQLTRADSPDFQRFSAHV